MTRCHAIIPAPCWICKLIRFNTYDWRGLHVFCLGLFHAEACFLGAAIDLISYLACGLNEVLIIVGWLILNSVPRRFCGCACLTARGKKRKVIRKKCGWSRRESKFGWKCSSKTELKCWVSGFRRARCEWCLASNLFKWFELQIVSRNGRIHRWSLLFPVLSESLSTENDPKWLPKKQIFTASRTQKGKSGPGLCCNPIFFYSYRNESQ